MPVPTYFLVLSVVYDNLIGLQRGLRKLGFDALGLLGWRKIALFAAVFGMAADLATATPLSCLRDRCSSGAHRFHLDLAESQERLSGKNPDGPNPWRQFETARPGGSVVSAISRTADEFHSDAGFAGVTIRCNESGDLDLVLVLLEAFPAKSMVNVVLGSAPDANRYTANVLAPGLALLLPDQNLKSASSPWQKSKELEIEIDGPQKHIHGVVDLDGIHEALLELLTKCSPAVLRDRPPE
jgi:hypothetical protein